jgi:chorismate mutase/mRNA-degrading endonuclease toxin of MazEF toxin-antitoxin module
MSRSGIGIEQIRREIDAIDTSMHELLMQRGELIEALQEAKGVGGASGTTALRPAREAQMLRALAERHKGAFPLVSVERIWREIIGSFTQLQAPFHVVMSGADPAELREYARHYFSVTTPVSLAEDAGAVIDAIASDETVVGVVVEPASKRRAGGAEPWWVTLALRGEGPARVVSRFPFLIGADGGQVAQRPAYMLSRAPVEPSGEDVTIVAVPVENSRDPAVAKTEVELAFVHAQLGGLSMRLTDLAEKPGGGGLALVEIRGHLAAALIEEADTGLRWLGGYPVPFDLAANDEV